MSLTHLKLQKQMTVLIKLDMNFIPLEAMYFKFPFINSSYMTIVRTFGVKGKLVTLVSLCGVRLSPLGTSATVISSFFLKYLTFVGKDW
jgi:hypothetical protein